MALPGGKDSECWQPETEGHNLLGPGDCISCQAVSWLYPWASSIHELPLIMASWDLGQFIPVKSVITREQLLWGDAQLTMHGLYACGVSEKLTRMILSSAWKTWSTRDYDITAILRAWVALWNNVLWNILEPEQLGPGKCIRQRAPPGTMLRQNTRPLWPGKSRRCMA